MISLCAVGNPCAVPALEKLHDSLAPKALPWHVMTEMSSHGSMHCSIDRDLPPSSGWGGGRLGEGREGRRREFPKTGLDPEQLYIIVNMVSIKVNWYRMRMGLTA